MEMNLDFSRCRNVWVPDDSDAGGFWSPPPAHVRVGVEQIIQHPYFLLADDMGGMKTAQAIIAAQFLHDLDIIDRVIVVAPASVRSTVWFDRDLGQLNDQVFADKRHMISEYHNKLRQWHIGPDSPNVLRWIVTNYEYIRREENLAILLRYCTDKTLLILDESSAVRTWDSEQTSACMRLRWKCNKRNNPVMGAARCGRILLLNGTPIAESPLDLFSQANLLHPSILDCRYVSHFKARYAIQAPTLGSGGRQLSNTYGKPIMHVESWTNPEDLQARMKPYVLRREAKELGIDFALPPVGIEVPLSAKTWKHYCAMRDELVIWLKTGVATASTAAVKSIRLAQITSGFVGGIEDAGVDDDTVSVLSVDCDLPFVVSDTDADVQQASTQNALQVRRASAGTADTQEIGREKLDTALALQTKWLASDPNLKLLTWCRFVPELRRYLKEVAATFKHPVGAACGEKILANMESQKKERADALRLLHPKTAPPGALTVGATQGTGAMGLNFTASHTVLDMSYDFSDFKKKQGDARVNRPGQTQKVSFFYLIAVGPRGQRTIDHHIMLTRLGKSNINEWTTAAWAQKLMEE